MSQLPSFRLNNGVEIPAIGLGTAPSGSAEEQKAWIVTALKSGYRHIDTAYLYGTEKVVAEAIKESGIPREEVFVTTKLPWHHTSRVEYSLDQSLANLKAGLGHGEYYDLYLMHWPQAIAYEGDQNKMPRNEDGSIKLDPNPPSIGEVWAHLEAVLASGKAKAIGVSNFSIKTLEELLQSAKVVPAVNQVELHPYLAQKDLLAYCKEKGIILAAYTPTGYATVRDDPTIVSLASKYKVSPAQIILAWHVGRGTIACPKSANAERQKENISLPTLSAEDVKVIDALDKGERLCNKAGPDGKVWGWTYDQLGW